MLNSFYYKIPTTAYHNDFIVEIISAFELHALVFYAALLAFYSTCLYKQGFDSNLNITEFKLISMKL